MRLFKTQRGIVVEHQGKYHLSPVDDWDKFVNRPDLYNSVRSELRQWAPDPTLAQAVTSGLRPPIGNQEVWACGITFIRSRQSYVEDTKETGAVNSYTRVYEADRPEIFFKATAYRTVGHGDGVRVRSDSHITVPEPELTLFISSAGTIEGYTIGNDMSARDIEGENALYLSQAKCYDGSAAIGPCLYVTNSPIDPGTLIRMDVISNNESIFSGEVSISRMKRKHTDLVNYLFKETSFKYGVYLMTGTGIIPPENFTLTIGDEIRISIDEIGTLVNKVVK
jgi:2-dehydro-3-deoxy-D-arabinonate dehydratase